MRFAALAALLSLAACKKAAPPAPEPRPIDSASLPMPAANSDEKAPKPEIMRKLDAIIDADQRLADRNRRTMIVAAPADFKPDPAARKIKLNIVLEKTKLKVGESPRFRLELTNVGHEPIDYIEYQSSIFRGGSIGDSIRTMRFVLIDRTGKILELFPALNTGRAAPMIPMNGPPSEQEEAESHASTTFQVKILPGETLRSLGDGDSAAEPFRTLRVQEGFGKPGKFTLRVELDDRPGPLTDSFIKITSKFQTEAETRQQWARREANALGPVVSNTIDLEVVR